MLGGALWCVGNVTVVPIVNNIGLSLGMLLWGLSNMLVGWYVSQKNWISHPNSACDVSLPVNISIIIRMSWGNINIMVIGLLANLAGSVLVTKKITARSSTTSVRHNTVDIITTRTVLTMEQVSSSQQRRLRCICQSSLRWTRTRAMKRTKFALWSLIWKRRQVSIAMYVDIL